MFLYSILFCSILRYSLLFYSMLFSSMLFSSILFFSSLFHFIAFHFWYYIIRYFLKLYYITLFLILLQIVCILLRYSVLSFFFCIISFFIYYILFYCLFLNLFYFIFFSYFIRTVDLRLGMHHVLLLLCFSCSAQFLMIFDGSLITLNFWTCNKTHSSVQIIKFPMTQHFRWHNLCSPQHLHSYNHHDFVWRIGFQ